MDCVKEVLVLSDSNNRNVNCNIYDLTSGALITSYQGGNSIQKGLAFIGDDCLISALADKPKFKIWTLDLKYTEDFSMDAPGLVEALAVSDCGTYCIASIGGKVFLWEIASGMLLSQLDFHAKHVSCLRFSSDGSHFITGGKDGIVFVWLTSEVVSTSDLDNPKPRFTWNDHAAEVTDIFVGSLGIYARIATASRDMTCRIYELETGLLLTTVCVDYAITSVVMDETQYFLFLGSAEGDIYKINLFSATEPELHYDSSMKKCAFIGHNDEITGLSISATGKYLASGSKDGEARIWDISNFNCMRKIASGPVTNIFITIMPPGLKEGKQFFPRLTSLKAFKPVSSVTCSDRDVRIEGRNLSLFHLGAPDDYFDEKILNSSSETLEAMMKSQMSLEDMVRINSEIFSAALSETIVATEEDEDEDEESPGNEDEEEEDEIESDD